MDTSICPKFENAMGVIGQRWTGLIIFQLIDGPKRFCNLESSMGVSGRVLSERLKSLESEGIVEREVYPETPVRIEYKLTEKGKAIEPFMNELQKWAEEWCEPKQKLQEV
ncbi:winged helix-turn-helix transcriptional regulator [Salinicoccus halodurans]|uniref:HxlR family transcriptional regulator n=1 Tax=Salinicoccus halodurans TaxID=407035 RepID=A0A0F7D4V2_9STAP|nr:winged helix-turn-helix transcriptional regulator [Salinicoccus halodurans]AKG74880.1 HxlR family transcriptional regulator [Salinicoccus halodurans]SFK68989.1 transcriptional regulator, HxlR family [Salinicoccus halodurans]